MAVERETALADAVGEAADGGAEVVAVIEVLLRAVESEDDVSRLAGAVRSVERLDTGTEGDDPYPDARPAREVHRLDAGAVGKRPEGCAPRRCGAGVRHRGDRTHAERRDQYGSERCHRSCSPS